MIDPLEFRALQDKLRALQLELETAQTKLLLARGALKGAGAGFMLIFTDLWSGANNLRDLARMEGIKIHAALSSIGGDQ